jgi:hypothetical protein
VAVSPGTNIQSVVDAHPAGTVFWLRAGVHRMQRITPKANNAFVGEYGAVLSGGQVLSGFARTGSTWSVGGQVQQGAATGVCSGGVRCQVPEDLYLDGRILQHVPSLAQVGPGRWFFDYGADRIHLGDDPNGRRVETSVLPTAINSTAGGVRVENLVVELYANPAQSGAIATGSGWVVTRTEVRHNHGAGIFVRGDDWRMVANNVHHNGQIGIAGNGARGLVEGNVIAGNNTAGFDYSWEAGGTKFAYTTSLVVRGNTVTDNNGPGLWTDIDNLGTLMENNVVVGNVDAGIFHEISYDAVIRNNIVNGTRSPVLNWVSGAGILVSNSRNVEVYGNRLEGNHQGITGLMTNRGGGRHGPWELVNLNVHDNESINTAGRHGIIQNVGDRGYFTNRNNRYTNNTYRGATSYFWNDTTIDQSSWRGAGNDTTGRWS